MKKYCYSITFIFLVLLSSFSVEAQDAKAQRYRADRLFEIKNYAAASEIYEALIDGGERDVDLLYKAGASLVESREIQKQLKALPYLEFAYQNKDEKLPREIDLYLGIAYHKSAQLNKALEHFNAYKKQLGASDNEALKNLERHFTHAQNALAEITKEKSYKIYRLEMPINSEYTEYNPVVMADESMMAYTALRPDPRRPRELVENIFISYKNNGKWSEPKPLDIQTRSNIGTAGLSPDGRQMIIFISTGNNTGSLYTIDKVGDKWSNPSPLGNNINSGYLETTASITPDGKTIYFASNRRGGMGGMDLYKVEKQPNGSWGPAQNLGPEVNTADNEDAPFIHPNGKILFFTSDGIGSMGGKDIFKTELVNGKWSKPENMGYPVNTVADDSYFTLTADGTKGFFSSDRPGGLGGQDIYAFDMPAQEGNIPLTLIKGRILAGEDPVPVPTKIKVVDNTNGQTLDYVYNPDEETGNYLIIIPPGKNYDMIIEATGFLPYTININIPEQDYFYELYQQINLSPITQFERVVGQKVSVTNAFYDTKQENGITPRQANESMLLKNDSIDVYTMMEDIIAASDAEALDYLLELMYLTNPIDDVNFKKEDAEAVESVYYFEENDKTKLEAKIIDSDTIYTLPTIFVAEEVAKQKELKNKQKSYDATVLNKVFKFYFDVDKSDVDPKYFNSLDEVLKLLNEHEDLGIEISGFASADGNEEYNRKISNERAIAVLSYFNERGVSRRRIIAKGFGATAQSGSKEEGRRVEVKIVDHNIL